MNEIMQYVVFCDWLLSLSLTFSRFIRVVTRIIFYGRVILHRVDIPHSVFHSSVDGQLGCFHPLAVMNSAAVNTVHRLLCGRMLAFLLGVCLGVQLLGHAVTLCLIVRGAARLFSSIAGPFYIPTDSVRGL